MSFIVFYTFTWRTSPFQGPSSPIPLHPSPKKKPWKTTWSASADLIHAPKWLGPQKAGRFRHWFAIYRWKILDFLGYNWYTAVKNVALKFSISFAMSCDRLSVIQNCVAIPTLQPCCFYHEVERWFTASLTQVTSQKPKNPDKIAQAAQFLLINFTNGIEAPTTKRPNWCCTKSSASFSTSKKVQTANLSNLQNLIEKSMWNPRIQVGQVECFC